jgi:putative ABC transport system permease protein
LVLSFCSGLLLRSLITAENSDPGFVTDRLLAMELSLPSSSYKNRQSIGAFYDRLEQDLRNLPGVAQVAKVACPPSAGICMDWWYSVADGPAPARGDVPLTAFNKAGLGYFQTMRIPLREGRDFTESDRQGSPEVAIVNEAIARRWWPHEAAAGHRIKFGGPYMEGSMVEIVGVAGNVSQEGLDGTPAPEIYFPFAQSSSEGMVIMIRTNGDPSSLIPAVRRAVYSLDRNLPIQSLQPFEKTVTATLSRRRFGTTLLSAFAGLALLLSAVGVYGLLNYWVAARQQEIAIRMALGAQRSTILGWAGLAATKLVAIGLVLGLIAAWAASHSLEKLVFGVSPRNSLMLIASGLVVTAMAGLAAALPLLRATRVDAAARLQQS